MKIRKISSLTAASAFIIMMLTSVILYIVPQGRIAYWADWKLWGLTKEQWGDIHINTGILFLLALALHVYYNWKTIVSYLKSKTKTLIIFTREFNLSLAIVGIFLLGTFFEVPPFSSILALSENIKDNAAEKYGEPPYGHAELSSLKTFTSKLGLDLNESVRLLKTAGIEIEGEMQTIGAIAESSNRSPNQIYLLIKPAEIHSDSSLNSVKALPDSPPAGTGNLTLADLCSQYNLNTRIIIRELAKQNIVASESLTLKKIAENNQTGPLDVYEHIKIIASNQSNTS